mgnify:CR=1 FL=1
MVGGLHALEVVLYHEDGVAGVDETAEHGVVYRYAVAALDQAGNESEPTEPVEASLP